MGGPAPQQGDESGEPARLESFCHTCDRLAIVHPPLRVCVLRGGQPVFEVPLGPAGVRVGRAPDNDLVLTGPDISWGHAEFWAHQGRAYVRDRGSSNGTFVNGWRVRVPLPVSESDEIRLGATTLVQVAGGATAPPEAPRGWLIEDVTAGVLLPPGAGHPQVLPPDPQGIVQLASGDRVAAGELFSVGDRTFRVVPEANQPVDTAGAAGETWPYRLSVSLDGPTGPEATLSHRGGPGRCQIRAENRAVLLYVLARQAVEDRRRGLPADRAGWCDDDDVVTGIWGREGATMDVNGLHVLLHRVRREVEKAVFDPAFLEKRNRGLRVALLDVSVD